MVGFAWCDLCWFSALRVWVYGLLNSRDVLFMVALWRCWLLRFLAGCRASFLALRVVYVVWCVGITVV